jgi:hypothetical protein
MAELDIAAYKILDEFHQIKSQDHESYYIYQKILIDLLLLPPGKISSVVIEQIVKAVLHGFEQDYGIHKSTIFLLENFFNKLEVSQFEYFYRLIIGTYYNHNSNQVRQGVVRLLGKIGKLQSKQSLKLLAIILYADRDYHDVVRFAQMATSEILKEHPEDTTIVLQDIIGFILKSEIESERADYIFRLLNEYNFIETLLEYSNTNIELFIDKMASHLNSGRASYSCEEILKRLNADTNLSAYHEKIKNHLATVIPSNIRLETEDEAKIRWSQAENEEKELLKNINIDFLSEEETYFHYNKINNENVRRKLLTHLNELFRQLTVDILIQRYLTCSPIFYQCISDELLRRLFRYPGMFTDHFKSLSEQLLQIIQVGSFIDRDSFNLLQKIIERLSLSEQLIVIEKLCSISYTVENRMKIIQLIQRLYDFRITGQIPISKFILNLLDIDKDDAVCANASTLIVDIYSDIIENPKLLTSEWLNNIKEFIVSFCANSQHPNVLCFLDNSVWFALSLLHLHEKLSKEQFQEVIDFLICCIDSLDCSFILWRMDKPLSQLFSIIDFSKQDAIKICLNTISEKLERNAIYSTCIKGQTSPITQLLTVDHSHNARLYLDKTFWLAQKYADQGQFINAQKLLSFKSTGYDYLSFSSFKLLLADSEISAGLLDEAISTLEYVDVKFVYQVPMMLAQIYYQKRCLGLAEEYSQRYYELYGKKSDPFTQRQIDYWISKSETFSVTLYTPKKHQLDYFYEELKKKTPDNIINDIEEILKSLAEVFGRDSLEKASSEYPFDKEYLKSLMPYENQVIRYIYQFVEFLVKRNIDRYYRSQYLLLQDKAKYECDLEAQIKEAKLCDILYRDIGQSTTPKELLTLLKASSCRVYTVFEFLKTYAFSSELVDAFALGISEDMASTYDVFVELFKLQHWEASYGLYNIYDTNEQLHTEEFFRLILNEQKPVIFLVPSDIGDETQQDGVTYNEAKWILTYLKSSPEKLKNIILVFDAYNYLPYYVLKKEYKSNSPLVNFNALDDLKDYICDSVTEPSEKEKFLKVQAAVKNSYPERKNIWGEIQYKLILTVGYSSAPGANIQNLEQKKIYLLRANSFLEECRKIDSAQPLFSFMAFSMDPSKSADEFFEYTKYFLIWLAKCVTIDQFAKLIFEKLIDAWKKELENAFDSLFTQCIANQKHKNFNAYIAYLLPNLEQLADYLDLRNLTSLNKLFLIFSGKSLSKEGQALPLISDCLEITLQEPRQFKNILAFAKENSIHLNNQVEKVIEDYFEKFKQNISCSKECIQLLVEINLTKFSNMELLNILNLCFKYGFSEQSTVGMIATKLQTNGALDKLLQFAQQSINILKSDSTLATSHVFVVLKVLNLSFPQCKDSTWRCEIVLGLFELMHSNKFGVFIPRRNNYMFSGLFKEILEIINKTLSLEEKKTVYDFLKPYEPSHNLAYSVFLSELGINKTVEIEQQEELSHQNQNNTINQTITENDSDNNNQLASPLDEIALEQQGDNTSKITWIWNKVKENPKASALVTIGLFASVTYCGYSKWDSSLLSNLTSKLRK